MECPVLDNHWDGELTLNPSDRQYYCPRHTTKCVEPGCEKVFFDCELGPDFYLGACCDFCYYERPYWCDKHAFRCQICGMLSEMCDTCTLRNTNDKYISLCYECFEKLEDDPCSLVLVKRAK